MGKSLIESRYSRYDAYRGHDTIADLPKYRPHGIEPVPFLQRMQTMTDITYGIEPDLSADEFIDCLVRSTLSERRPVDRREIIETMLRKADIIVTARSVEGVLVGISRALSDFSFCTYLSDLAVDVQFQGHGIGKRLIEETHIASGLHTMLILLSAPKAQTYYPHIGMTQHPSAWYLPRQESAAPPLS